METVAETESFRLPVATKPFSDGVMPLHLRSAKLVERFKELYKNDRVQITNALKGIPDKSAKERLVFSIIEVRTGKDGGRGDLTEEKVDIIALGCKRSAHATKILTMAGKTMDEKN